MTMETGRDVLWGTYIRYSWLSAYLYPSVGYSKKLHSWAMVTFLGKCIWVILKRLYVRLWNLGYIGDTLGYIGIHRAIFLDARYPTLNALHHHGDIWKPDIYFIKHGTFKVNCLHLSKCHFNPTCLYFILLLQQCFTIWSEYILFYLNF